MASKPHLQQADGGPPSPNAADAQWRIRPPFTAKSVAVVVILVIGLALSAQHLGVGEIFKGFWDLVLTFVGAKDSSQIGRGFSQVGDTMFPLAIDLVRPIDAVENFDRERLPIFSHLEVRQITEQWMNPDTLSLEPRTVEVEYLVQRGGYVFFVLGRMVQTVEIAVWATLLSVALGAPLAVCAARNYAPHAIVYAGSRTIVTFLRAVPELISALFLVLAFGFGPAAGILALGLHAAGFLGKFYAEDIEGADPAPQDALRAAGLGRLKILRLAVFPQVLPNYMALTLYILDRNIRMATIIGLVGAGGIGQELKGRYDLLQYDHVGTIIVIIFLAILALDVLSSRIRKSIL